MKESSVQFAEKGWDDGNSEKLKMHLIFCFSVFRTPFLINIQTRNIFTLSCINYVFKNILSIKHFLYLLFYYLFVLLFLLLYHLPFFRWILRYPDWKDLRWSQDGLELWDIFQPPLFVSLYRKHRILSSSRVTKGTSRLPIKYLLWPSFDVQFPMHVKDSTVNYTNKAIDLWFKQ